MTPREARLTAFLEDAGWGSAERRVLAADASFRRYDRLNRAGETAVLMDAPPPQENVAAFHRVQSLLLALGLSAPKALAVDLDEGFMLLEDFGDRTFTSALANGVEEAELYRLAVDLLIELHRRFQPATMAAGLPRYDYRQMLQMAGLFADWYLPAVGIALSEDQRADYDAAWQRAFRTLERVPQTLILRDYHVDNLMQLSGRKGVAACGLLDFQDAAIGPVAYDLVSLLQDVRRDVAPGLVAALYDRYLAANPAIPAEDFAAAYAVSGAQRNTRILGVFTRLQRRDGKPHYLRHMKRTWQLLEQDLAHPVLADLRHWFDQMVPPEQRRSPDEGKA